MCIKECGRWRNGTHIWTKGKKSLGGNSRKKSKITFRFFNSSCCAVLATKKNAHFSIGYGIFHVFRNREEKICFPVLYQFHCVKMKHIASVVGLFVFYERPCWAHLPFDKTAQFVETKFHSSKFEQHINCCIWTILFLCLSHIISALLLLNFVHGKSGKLNFLVLCSVFSCGIRGRGNWRNAEMELTKKTKQKSNWDEAEVSSFVYLGFWPKYPK